MPRILVELYASILTEQNHRWVNSRIAPMLGFTRFANASIVIGGIENVAESRKSQFKVASLITRARGDIQDSWKAVLVELPKA